MVYIIYLVRYVEVADLENGPSASGPDLEPVLEMIAMSPKLETAEEVAAHFRQMFPDREYFVDSMPADVFAHEYLNPEVNR